MVDTVSVWWWSSRRGPMRLGQLMRRWGLRVAGREGAHYTFVSAPGCMFFLRFFCCRLLHRVSNKVHALAYPSR